jgi:sulfite exporter TauE/SafE
MIATLAGFIAGTVHVFAGPDHLAAVAPLAVRGHTRAWRTGLGWGLGHVAGVAVVGLLAFWLRTLLPVDLISSWSERLVGVVLLGIGLWGLRKAWASHLHAHEHVHDGEAHRHLHVHVHGHRPGHDHSPAHAHTHAAFGMGIVHGLAGSSHFLGILPALAFPSAQQAVAYLLAFGLGTIAAMVTFSSVMGLVARRSVARGAFAYRGLMGTCSAAAVVVGCAWLVL